jgi:predicted amidohydrolase
MRSGRKIADNLQEADRLIREAARQGAHYVLTPENTALMELDPELVKLHAEPFDNNTVLAMFRALARELGICLQIGSLAIHLANWQKVVNRSVLISPEGRITAFYDKIHLFDVDLPNGENYRESDSCLAGNKGVVTSLPLDLPVRPKIGFSICYDLRFPMLYRVLAKAGAEIITVPAAFTEQTGKAHWLVLLRARAIETGCYVLASAQGGLHENGRWTYGHSLMVSPWGDIIAQAGTDPQILIAELDLSKVAKARSHIPSLTHDRPFEITDMSSDKKLEGIK